MTSGLQRPGGPSHASRLRGEAPPYKSSRMGTSGVPSPPKPINYLPNTPSNLGMYSQAHTNTGRPMKTGRNLPNDDSWKNSSANTVRTKSRLPEDDSWKADTPTKEHTYSKDKWEAAANPKEVCQSRAQGPRGITDSLASLSINSTSVAEPVAKGRCLDWERPVFTSSNNSKVSKYLPKYNREHGKPTPSAYSISYRRRHAQTPMEQATYREYLPFTKSEFKVGMIIRMNIHESDFKGTSKTEIAQASQASTLVDGGKGDRPRREHRHHGDFGPIYSENRIFIVVNVAEDVYTAIPLFTHQGKGLARILDKKSWVSVEDHRQLGRCVQQSEHQPLRTAVLSAECDVLDPVSAAWIPYAFPCRYDVPVAYQGKLDRASARRLVRLHRETWIDDVSDED